MEYCPLRKGNQHSSNTSAKHIRNPSVFENFHILIKGRENTFANMSAILRRRCKYTDYFELSQRWTKNNQISLITKVKPLTTEKRALWQNVTKGSFHFCWSDALLKPEQGAPGSKRLFFLIVPEWQHNCWLGARWVIFELLYRSSHIFTNCLFCVCKRRKFVIA